MSLSCARPPPHRAHEVLKIPVQQRRWSRGEALYALAYLGSHIAFMPFLVLLLPRRVAAISGSGGEHLLSGLLLIGAITASLANIIAGRYSDRIMARIGSRRLSIAVGLASILACYSILAVSYVPWVLACGVIGFQIAVNLLFAPIGVLITDYIPDHRKGRISGVLNCSLPIANSSVAVVALLAPNDGIQGFAVTAALIGICLLPLLIMWPFERRPPHHAVNINLSFVLPVRNLVLVWWTRCLLQVGAIVLTNYLYTYLAFLQRNAMIKSSLTVDAEVGWLSLLAGCTACFGALTVGRLSDQLAERRIPLVGSGILAALGLSVMATAHDWPALATGYALFHLALAAFLAVEGAFVAEMVADYRARGHLMGYMNLANTFPAIVSAAVAFQSTRHTSFNGAMPAILIACAVACLIASGLAAIMRDTKATPRRPAFMK